MPCVSKPTLERQFLRLRRREKNTGFHLRSFLFFFFIWFFGSDPESGDCSPGPGPEESRCVSDADLIAAMSPDLRGCSWRKHALGTNFFYLTLFPPGPTSIVHESRLVRSYRHPIAPQCRKKSMQASSSLENNKRHTFFFSTPGVPTLLPFWCAGGNRRVHEGQEREPLAGKRQWTTDRFR